MSRKLTSQRDPEELLQRLNETNFDGLTPLLRKVYRPKTREVELRYFELAVKNMEGDISEDAVINGLFSSGRLSLYVKPYFYISFNYKPRFVFRCGCGAFFKTWLTREGGREGPAAFQGEKALGEPYRLRGLRESAVRLVHFLEETRSWLHIEEAKVRALSILKSIQVDDGALQQRINDAIREQQE